MHFYGLFFTRKNKRAKITHTFFFSHHAHQRVVVVATPLGHTSKKKKKTRTTTDLTFTHFFLFDSTKDNAKSLLENITGNNLWFIYFLMIFIIIIFTVYLLFYASSSWFFSFSNRGVFLACVVLGWVSLLTGCQGKRAFQTCSDLLQCWPMSRSVCILPAGLTVNTEAHAFSFSLVLLTTKHK